MSIKGVERIEHRGRAYAIVLRATASSDEKYNFLTGPESPLQLGFNFYAAGEIVKAHYHPPRELETNQFNEFLLIGEGRTKLTLFDADDQTPFWDLELGAGDMVLLLVGGHGFQMLEPTKIVEIKQGPYEGQSKDKVVFGRVEQSFIPVCEPLLAGRELEYVTKAVSGGSISSSGGYVKEFEQAFAKYLDVPCAVTTTSGTAALHLALVAAGVGPGDEVIIPAFTMIATAFAVCYTGAKPVFVDADAASWNIDPAQIEQKLSPRTKAILPVHIYGHACDMDAIDAVADAKDLLVIEDAAEAIGSRYNGKLCGALGDLSCFSFFANTLITTGEGGMVVARHERFAEKLRYYKDLCFPLNGPRRYVHEDIGFNYRMPNVLAAIGLAQLERADFYLECRRKNAVLYDDRLRGQRGITTPPNLPYTLNSYWMYGILIEDDFGLSRDEVMSALFAAGIDTRPFFVSMHRQPALQKYGCDTDGEYPVTDTLARKGLYLPSGSGLSESDLNRTIDVLLSLRPK